MGNKGLIRAFTALSTVLLLITLGVGNAMAGAVLVSGDIALGVNDEGHLNFSDGIITSVNAGDGSAVGIAYSGYEDGVLRDATSPGCLCEGWGVSASGVSASASIHNGGVNNLTLDSFTSSATEINSTVSLTSLSGLSISQTYSAAAAAPGALFEDVVVITNNTGSTLTDLRYSRAMDWDIPMNEFNEFVTIQGTATTTALETSHDNGFSNPDPLAGTFALDPATLNVDFVDNGAADHGAYFLFNFGDLADGESYEFSIFYGAAANETEMLAALGAVGTELYSLGQASSSAFGGSVLNDAPTFAFGFAGVGGEVIIDPDPIPEPSTILLLGAGLTGLAFWRKRKNV